MSDPNFVIEYYCLSPSRAVWIANLYITFMKDPAPRGFFGDLDGLLAYVCAKDYLKDE